MVRRIIGPGGLDKTLPTSGKVWGGCGRLLNLMAFPAGSSGSGLLGTGVVCLPGGVFLADKRGALEAGLPV